MAKKELFKLKAMKGMIANKKKKQLMEIKKKLNLDYP